MFPRKHHFWSFFAISIAVFQIQRILILIPLKYEDDAMGICAMGWRYAQNTIFLFRAEVFPRKHKFWSFLAITIAVCQIQMILILIPLQYEDDGMGICAKHSNFIQNRNDSFKTPFLVVFGYNNCSGQIQMILTLIPLQNEQDGIEICAKHSNFIQNGNYSFKTPFLVVYIWL